MHHTEDTIVAIASPAGGAPRGIVRLCGPQVLSCLERCFQTAQEESFRRIRHPSVVQGELHVGPPIGSLEGSLFVWPDSRSFTRQPMAELHTMGSPPLLDAAVLSICRSGARLAEPGEFTMRAFLAGRLDLTQAEAVLGVIDAQSRHELDVALTQLAGGLATPLRSLRDELLDLLAHLEAGLDFVEEDISFITENELREHLHRANADLASISEQLSSRQRNQDRPRIVLIGWPNVGKSSLFNALCQDSAAIVTGAAGTTRDFLSRNVVFGGVELTLIDTAGVQAASEFGEELSAAAQHVRAGQQRQADLQLLCLDLSRPLNDWERQQLGESQPANRLVVGTKADTVAEMPAGIEALPTSSLTRQGLDALRLAVTRALEHQADRETGAVVSTAVRCRENFRRAAESLAAALQVATQSAGEELVAAEIRVALDELGKVLGDVYTDDLLDRIFGRFCIGK
jgi:tRNA modification GTPase